MDIEDFEPDLEGVSFDPLVAIPLIAGVLITAMTHLPTRHWLTWAVAGLGIAIFIGGQRRRWRRRALLLCLIGGAAGLGAVLGLTPPGSLLSFDRLASLKGQEWAAFTALSAGIALAGSLELLLWRLLTRALGGDD